MPIIPAIIAKMYINSIETISILLYFTLSPSAQVMYGFENRIQDPQRAIKYSTFRTVGDSVITDSNNA